MKAYDIDIGPWRTGTPDRSEDGWCFGLPPGIAPDQWPLDPVTGYPLMHGFTLLLPEDYRVHGPEIVALSFFSTPADGNDGGRAGWREDVAALIDTPPSERPDDPLLHPWWERVCAAHPRLHRMRDILHYGYAVVLLTQAEFDAPGCVPPEPVADPRHDLPPPEWLSRGSASAYEKFSGRGDFDSTPDPWSIHRPLRAIARERDENAGLGPRESWDDEPTDTGYRNYFYWEGGVVAAENWREHDWAAGHEPNHVGGTMRPVQGIPEFSPYYIGFEETLGGYNFGGGNAQLDFRDMKFDWACG